MWINCIKTINVYVSIIFHLPSPPKCTLIEINRKYHNPGCPAFRSDSAYSLHVLRDASFGRCSAGHEALLKPRKTAAATALSDRYNRRRTLRRVRVRSLLILRSLRLKCILSLLFLLLLTVTTDSFLSCQWTTRAVWTHINCLSIATNVYDVVTRMTRRRVDWLLTVLSLLLLT